MSKRICFALFIGVIFACFFANTAVADPIYGQPLVVEQSTCDVDFTPEFAADIKGVIPLYNINTAFDSILNYALYDKKGNDNGNDFRNYDSPEVVAVCTGEKKINCMSCHYGLNDKSNTLKYHRLWGVSDSRNWTSKTKRT